MRKMPPLISDEGTLTVHGQEGVELYVNFTDDLGAPRNMSGVDVRFQIPGFSENLTTTATLGEMMLSLSKTDLPNLIGKLTDYAIVEHNGTNASVHYFGKLVMVGWR